MAFNDPEEEAYRAEVVLVKKWWTDSRWRSTKRPFTAEQIVAKRGNLKIDYPSNVQSKKLWAILEKRFKVTAIFLCAASWSLSLPVLSEITFAQDHDASFTYGCLDPVMVTQMAKYLDTVYVSGWQSSSTASSTDEPSPDLADYPMVRPRSL